MTATDLDLDLDPDAEPDPVSGPTDGAAGAAWPRRLAVGALVLALCGVLCAAGFGIALAMATSSDDAVAARTRDVVRQDAENAAAVLNTLSPETAEDGLTRWEEVATGPLLAELRRSRAAFVETIRQAQRSTQARPLHSAVATLDVAGGTAAVLVSTDIVTTPAIGEPVTNRQRLEVIMTRTDDGWKASGVRVIGLNP